MCFSMLLLSPFVLSRSLSLPWLCSPARSVRVFCLFSLPPLVSTPTLCLLFLTWLVGQCFSCHQLWRLFFLFVFVVIKLHFSWTRCHQTRLFLLHLGQKDRKTSTLSFLNSTNHELLNSYFKLLLSSSFFDLTLHTPLHVVNRSQKTWARCTVKWSLSTALFTVTPTQATCWSESVRRPKRTRLFCLITACIRWEISISPVQKENAICSNIAVHFSCCWLRPWVKG